MSIILKEYLESKPIDIHKSKNQLNVTEGYNALNLIAKDSIMTDIEGIHVGPTNNYTWYTEKALKASIPSWVKPYRKPFILHHNEKDGKIIGRVLNAEYTDVNTRSGTGALVFTCNVSDEEGKKGVVDGRFETVSIGVVAHDVKCSICDHSISDDGECEHERGVIYDGKTCYWIIDEMEAKELSYVIVPSDIYAHNIRIYEPTNKDIKKYEEGVNGVANSINLQESEDIKEKAEVVDEEAKQPEVKEEVKEPEKAVDEVVKDDVKKDEPKSIETLEATISQLEAVIAELKSQLETEKALKQEAETELVTANEQLKEYVIDRIMSLREQLGRPSVLKESLEKRTKLSLLDNIRDLEEEVNYVSNGSVKLVESEDINIEEENVDSEEVTENNNEDINNINLVLNESLIDEDKDKTQKNEKNLKLDVKEAVSSSNTDYETTCKVISDFYNL